MPKKRPVREPKKLTIDVVEARAFVLVDEYGNPRAELSTHVGDGGKEGITIIQMNDDMGRARLVLQVDPTGTSIRLFDSNNNLSVSMAVNDGHGCGVSISDVEGKCDISLGVPLPGSKSPLGPHPRIDVRDVPGNRSWSVFDGIHEFPSGS